MKISQETFTFLKDLRVNNDRDWFNAHKDLYTRVKEDFESYVDSIILNFSKDEPSILGLTGKKSVMRIYRDVRFSLDKSPYKTNLGASFHNPQNKGNFPGYFLSIGPGESFIAGGYWMPEGEYLKAIREEIDYNPEKFQSILDNKDFKSHFGGLGQESKLKTLPKGYSKDHPQIENLKLKSFTASLSLTDEELIDGKGYDRINSGLKALMPLVHFLKEVKA